MTPPPVDNLRGGLLMLINSAVFAVMVALIKIAAEEVPVAMVMLASVAVQAVAIWAWCWRDAGTILRRRSGHWAHLWRSALLMGSLFTGFWAVTLLPITEATALSFCKPLFVTMLAALLLREAVGLRRAAAVLTGFAGVLVLTGPGEEGLALPLLGVGLGLVSALAAAGGAIATRQLAQRERAGVMMMYQTAVGLVLFVPPAVAGWQTPPPDTLAVLVTIGALSVLGNATMIVALRHGEASAIAPIDFTRAVFAVIAGYLLLSEVPTAQGLIGTAIIILGALMALRRR